MKIRLGLFASVLGAASLVGSIEADATPVLDQSYTAFTPGDRAGVTESTFDFQRAMTFTVGITGPLSIVEVAVPLGTASTLGLDILSTSGGVPTETVLDTGTFASNSGGYSIFSVSLPVTAGEVLALEPFALTDDDLGWADHTPDTYAGGQDFDRNPDDGIPDFTSDGMGEDFETFVGAPSTAVPEPSSLPMILAGLAAIGGAFYFGRRKATTRV